MLGTIVESTNNGPSRLLPALQTIQPVTRKSVSERSAAIDGLLYPSVKILTGLFRRLAQQTESQAGTVDG